VEDLDLFDAVEYCHFYTAWLDYNRGARCLAQANDLPLVGTSDAHLPCQFGTTYSLIEAEPILEGVFGGIRAGRVRVVSRPLKTSELLAVGTVLTCGSVLGPGSWLVQALEEGLGVRAIGATADEAALPLAGSWQG
jgi:hypothetical protein